MYLNAKIAIRAIAARIIEFLFAIAFLQLRYFEIQKNQISDEYRPAYTERCENNNSAFHEIPLLRLDIIAIFFSNEYRIENKLNPAHAAHPRTTRIPDVRCIVPELLMMASGCSVGYSLGTAKTKKGITAAENTR